MSDAENVECTCRPLPEPMQDNCPIHGLDADRPVITVNGDGECTEVHFRGELVWKVQKPTAPALRDALRVTQLALDGAIIERDRALRDIASIRANGEAAAKWNALRNCQRITAMGCAGLLPGEDFDSNYGHVTLNFWTGSQQIAKYLDENGQDQQDQLGREWLDLFMMKVMRSAG